MQPSKSHFVGVLFALPLPKIVKISSKDNLKMIKNTLPNKSGNPESLKKIIRVRKLFK